MKQLQNSNVDLSSPLFKIGPKKSTTSVCTILVDSKANTRTCIFTFGNSGELTAEDVHSVDLESVFENAIHFHSDSRHTEAALVLAQEAKRRGIPVSLDCEKDRKNKSFDKLVEISDIVFTNSNCLDAYMKRLESDREQATKRPPLKPLTINGNDQSFEEKTLQAYTKSLQTNAVLSRWYPCETRQCIVTQ